MHHARDPIQPIAPPGPSLALADAISSERATGTAAAEIAERITASFAERGVKDAPDLLLVAVSQHHARHMLEIERVLASRLAPRHILGVSAEGIIGGSIEIEAAPAIGAMAFRMPGVTVTPFSSEDLPVSLGAAELSEEDTEDQADDLAKVGEATGIKPGHRCTMLFADPFTTPLDALLRTLSRARALCSPGGSADGDREGARRGPIAGGLASAANRPGGNVLLIDGKVTSVGCVGVSLAGNIKVDSVLSQGCKPFGANYVITSAQGQFIRSLGGRPALDVLEEAVESLTEAQRKNLSGGLLLGRVVNEYKDRFGRDDYIMRNVVGVMQKEQAIAVADRVRTGQTVRFHMRDARTADEDLALLLDAQALHERPEGIVLFTCNGRGTRAFNAPHHDAQAIQRAFAEGAGAAAPGESKAKGGFAIKEGAASTPPIPLMGFFAAGEIGPVGNEVFLHGQTASALIFRRS